MSRGHFRNGGELLVLPDWHEPVSGLCIRRADLTGAIERLRERLALPPR